MSQKNSKDYEKDYTKPKLREELKEKIKQESKGGKRGQWSARKSQLLKHEYEKQGGDYKHPGQYSEKQKDLTKWSKQDWQTDTHENAIHENETTRYLPRKVWENLSDKEHEKANRTKILGSKKNEQFVKNAKAAKKAMKKYT